jgi:urease accessory protein
MSTSILTRMLRPTPATERSVNVSATRIAVAAAEPRARVDLTVGMLAPRVVERGPTHVAVAISAAQMLLLDGDDLVMDVEVGAGCTLEVEDVGGTVAYPGVSSWHLVARVGDGGTLIWRGLPFVVAAGTRTRRTTEIVLGRDAAVLLRDTVVLGRHGERGGQVTSAVRIDRDGHPLLVEELEADAADSQVGVLGAHRVLDSVVAAGFRPPPVEGVLELEEPGAIARHLGAEAHGSGLDAVWVAWRAARGRERGTDETPGEPRVSVPSDQHGW